VGAPERLAGTLPFYYGWVIVGVGAAAVASRVVGSVEAASVFAAALIAEYGWSTTLLAAPIFIGSSASALGGPFVGRMLDRRGPRLVTAVGTALVGISCFVLAATDSIVFYVAFYALLRMTGQGMVQLSSQVTAAKWFERRRGRAIGFVSLISSMGLVAAPPIAQALNGGPGLAAAWMAYGFLALGLGTLPSALLLVRSPEDMGLQPDGALHRVGVQRVDQFSPANDDAGLCAPEKLVAREGDEIGPRLEEVAGERLSRQAEPGKVDEGAAARIHAQREAVSMGDLGGAANRHLA
jgi:MFS family permease